MIKPKDFEFVAGVDSKLKVDQAFKLPGFYTDSSHEIHVECHYSKDRDEKTSLSVNLPHVGGLKGILAEFEETAFSEGEPSLHQRFEDWAKYGHSEEAKEIFDREVKPFVVERLPKYMVTFMNKFYE
jgi:hypothetical protein